MKLSLPLLSTVMLATALAGLLGSALARADEAPWLVRGRLLDMRVKNANQDTPAAFQSLGPVEVQNKVFPEVDITRFLTPNLAAELILTYPQSHTVTLGGTTIGSVRHLPPVLTLQYHFAPAADIRPYAGIGINYTRFMDVQLMNGAVTTDQHSVGLSGQVGADIRLDPHWFLNVDAKYVQISTHVKLAASGTTITNLQLDPWLVAVGAGYRF